ncbi:MAG TPA: hypothetical protein VME86_09580 [Acidobacteriaceae bacterium]|nr:hypothetical protein [Acidobacteriaceae bacterium]
MRRWKRFAWYSYGLIQVAVLLVVATKPAYAYGDPGTGLLFLQVGGSMLAGAVFAFRAKVRKFLGIGKHTLDETENDAAAQETVSKDVSGPPA